MAIRRTNSKILADYVAGSIARAKYQEHDFPLIELTMQIEDGVEIKRGRLGRKKEPVPQTEIVVTMTLWEATQLLKQFQLQVSNATRLVLPKNAIAVPFQEGGGYDG